MNFKPISKWKVPNKLFLNLDLESYKLVLNFDFGSYSGNTGVWYKSVESNTGSPIFEQELELFHSVKFLSWFLLGNFFVFRHYSYKLFSIVRSTCRVIKVKALFAFQKCLYKNEEVEKRKKKSYYFRLLHVL